MKFFKKVLEIKSKEGVLHFTRWAIFECPYLRLYIHKINEADKDKHLHSHPWNFISVILKGSYIEELEDGKTKLKRPGTFSKMDETTFHKVKEIVKGPIYSLFLSYGKYNTWFYKVGCCKIECSAYRYMKRHNEL